jgi:hypothetical protein
MSRDPIRSPAARTAAPLLLALALGCGRDADTASEAPAAPGSAPLPAAGSPDRSGAAGGWFRDVSAASGLRFTHEAGKTDQKHLPETMGAGAALCDLDGDGDLDIYLVQGGPLPGREDGAPRPTNRLFLNDGSGRFEDATLRSGDAAHAGYGMGVAAADVDGDGDLDLYVTNLGPDVLLLNDGRARFTEATAAAGLGDPRWTTAAAFFDADGDGDADLYVAGYVQVDLDEAPWCGDRKPGWRSYCHPDVFPGLPDRFYRNRGDGTFEDRTVAAGLHTPEQPGKGLGVLACDVDADGDLDLYVANDSVENRLWLNGGDGRFTDATLVSGTGVDGSGRTEAGMGLASGDVDGDGDPDLFVTNFDDESNTLYRNDGQALFSDVTIRAGLEGPSRLPVGFGTVLEDLDDDGDLDLAVTNGHIIDNIELYHDGKSWKQTSQVFANDGAGRFVDRTAHAGDLSRRPLVGRGLYAGDLDRDGDLDLLLTQSDGPALLLANAGGADGADGATAGHAVTLAGLPQGTRVTARLLSGGRRVAEVGTQTSYLGLSAPELHLGLGQDALSGLSLAVPGRPVVELPLEPPVHSGLLRLLDDAGTWRVQSRSPHR